MAYGETHKVVLIRGSCQRPALVRQLKIPRIASLHVLFLRKVSCTYLPQDEGQAGYKGIKAISLPIGKNKAK